MLSFFCPIKEILNVTNILQTQSRSIRILLSRYKNEKQITKGKLHYILINSCNMFLVRISIKPLQLLELSWK